MKKQFLFSISLFYFYIRLTFSRRKVYNRKGLCFVLVCDEICKHDLKDKHNSVESTPKQMLVKTCLFVSFLLFNIFGAKHNLNQCLSNELEIRTDFKGFFL